MEVQWRVHPPEHIYACEKCWGEWAGGVEEICEEVVSSEQGGNGCKGDVFVSEPHHVLFTYNETQRFRFLNLGSQEGKATFYRCPCPPHVLACIYDRIFRSEDLEMDVDHRVSSPVEDAIPIKHGLCGTK